MVDIAVVIPAHPPRLANGMLAQAVASVCSQTLPPAEVHVAVDTIGAGAAATRNRGLAAVGAEWVAFLDSDDLLLPKHLELCSSHAASTGADVVYPYFETSDGSDTVGRFGVPFDPEALRRGNFIPVTVLARTEAVRAAGGFQPLRGGAAALEDWFCWLQMLNQGARFVHLPERTWVWHKHDGNTDGRPWRGRG